MGLHYFRCPCGLRFAWPVPPDQDAQYQDPAYFEALALETSDRTLLSMKIETARRRVAALQAAGAREPLLEVGCGNGLYQGEAGALVPTGVDIALPALAIAHRRHVHRIACARPEALPFPDRTFAAAAMYDTLEHLPRPLHALREIHRVLRPGALLHVTTPDAGGLPARLLGASFPHVNPEHVALFDRRALRAALEGAGFALRRLGGVRKPLTIHYLAARLARYRVPVATPLLGFLVRAAPGLSRRVLTLPSAELEAIGERR